VLLMRITPTEVELQWDTINLYKTSNFCPDYEHGNSIAIGIFRWLAHEITNRENKITCFYNFYSKICT
jgi:hypothetical protein